MAIWKDVLVGCIKYSILVAVFVYASAAIKKSFVFCSDSVKVFIVDILKPMTYFLCNIIEQGIAVECASGNVCHRYRIWSVALKNCLVYIDANARNKLIYTSTA